MTFAAAQYYDGSTTVERGATLLLGSGKTGGDGGLYRGGSLYRVIDNGSLVVRNRVRALSLNRISGTGSFTQAGAAAVTLTGSVSWTGATTVAKGMLALTSGASLRHSSGVRLTGSGAVLDLERAGSQTVKSLSVARDSTLRLGAKPLTVSGKVSLGGAVEFDLESAKGLTLIKNSGNDKVSGVFEGLPQNRTVSVAGKTFHISYTAGDGNDIALIAGAVKKKSLAVATSRAASPSPRGQVFKGTAVPVASTGTPPWRAALFCLLGLVGVGVYATRRRGGGAVRSSRERRHARS